MKKIIILLLILFPSIIFSQDGGTTCDTSEPMCSDNNGVKIFNNTTNTSGTGSTACLYTTPNPSWFYIKVESTGNLEFEIIQSTDFDTSGNPIGSDLDVDFAAWGPFSTSDSNCTTLAKECLDSSGNSIPCPDNVFSPVFYTNNLDNTNIIDCSYSGSGRENFTINNAQIGEFYILLITNYNNGTGKIKLEQTNYAETGAGTTDCSIVSGELGPDQDICDGTTVTLDGTPTVGTVTNYEWQVDTGSGFTTITGENNATLSINNNLSGTYKSIITDNLGNKATDDVVINFLPLPITTNITLNQCDTDTDLSTNINLTLAETNISTNHINETFKYYPTKNDAINDTAEITNQTNHPVTDGDTIWVRTISDKGCYQISEIKITVGYQADVIYPKEFANCDDYLDADGNNTASNSDTDGITYFDLSSVEPDIKATFPAANRANLTVLIFETIADRDAVTNNITNVSNYRNKNVPATTPQSLYVKIIDKTNNNCEGLGSFTIKALQTPIANNVANFEYCDDFASGTYNDGKNIDINLRDSVNNILGTSQAPSDYTVTFHTSPTDANSGNAPISNDTNYTNQTRDIETIYVRVENNDTGCFNDHLTFDIIINPLPVITNPIPDLEICDVITSGDGDSRNRIVQNINLSERDIDVLNGRDPALFEITYHRTNQDAIDGVSPLNKTNYTNDPAHTNFPADFSTDAPATELIYISILNKNTNCRYGIATLQLVIYPEPLIPLNITNYTDCDNKSDSFLDDANGINGDITLKNKTTEILVNYPTSEHSNFTVTFHENLSDVESGANPLDENKYENTANNQTIYVRVKNDKTSCVNNNLTFNIIINPLPDFIVYSPVIVCLNNPQTRLEPINPNATYSYEWTLKGNPTVLSTNAFYDVTVGGTYVVTATMQDGTDCKRSREIVVNESINPTLTNDDIVIVDDTNNSGLDNYSIKIITENQNLGIGDYEFAITDEDNNITGFQDEPLFDNISGGFYTVFVRDKNGCQPDATIEISVIEYPKFLTPNGDGKNDTWKIKGANSSFYPSSNITIVDRYGKIVAIIPIDNQGWNGTYKGKLLPSNDYWFKIYLVDRKGKIHQHQGHFSLLRK